MLEPPPPAERAPSSAVSFHTRSGIYERADALFALFAAFQYELPPSLNSVPPIPVTSGMDAGESTANPFCAIVAFGSSQSVAPASPDAANHVIPCAFACWATA